MCEILFRGKDIAGNWHCGVPLVFTEDYICMTAPHTYNKSVIPSTVGQFTGLTDKNGKKIFEGDIGRYKQTDRAKLSGKPITCIGKVVYNAKTASFAVDSKDDVGAKNYDYFPIKDFEVIGNTHDNPELLEVSE